MRAKINKLFNPELVKRRFKGIPIKNALFPFPGVEYHPTTAVFDRDLFARYILPEPAGLLPIHGAKTKHLRGNLGKDFGCIFGI